MNKLLAAPILSLTLLSACAGSVVKDNSTGVQAPQVAKKSGIIKAFKTDIASVEVDGRTARLQGQTDFMVPFYRVNYLKQSDYKNAVTSGSVSAKASVSSKLIGVNDTIYDAITEEAYTDFVAKMKARGYNVLEHNTSANVQRYVAKSDYPKATEKMFSDVPAGSTYSDSQFDDPVLKVHMSDKVNVMSVDLTANFVINNRNEKRFSLTEAKETVYTSQGVSVGGAVNARIPNSLIKMTIGQPVYSTKEFGTLKDATTKGQKTGDTLGMVASLALGGNMRRTTTTSKIVEADEAAYREALLDALKQANSVLVDKFASYK